MKIEKLLIPILVLSLLGVPNIQAKEAASPAASIEDDSFSLEECYHLALIQSETVAIQKEAIARATAQIFNAASQGLGKVDFVMNRPFQDGQSSNSGGSSSVINAWGVQDNKFTISQPLFQGFKAIARRHC